MSSISPALITNGIAENTIFRLDRLDLTVSPDPHPLLLSHAAEISDNWAAEVAANPSLYDGQMVLHSRITLSAGAVHAVGHVVPFSTLLYWRKAKPAGGAAHLFSIPVLLSADNAVIAIKMGAHTANPGKVYCAAGSLDPEDVIDGRCDADLNMAREVLEETGLSLADAVSVGDFHALHADDYVTLFRVYRFAEDAETLVGRIGAHAADEADPEIAGVVAICDADPGRHSYAHFMPPMLAWLFEGGQTS